MALQHLELSPQGGGGSRVQRARVLVMCGLFGGLLVALWPTSHSAQVLYRGAGFDTAVHSLRASAATRALPSRTGRPIGSSGVDGLGALRPDASNFAAHSHASGEVLSFLAGIPSPSSLWLLLLAPLLALPLLRPWWKKVANKLETASPLLQESVPQQIAMASWGSSRINHVTLLGDVTSDPQTFEFFDQCGNPRVGVAFYLNTFDIRNPQGTTTQTHRVIVTHTPLVAIAQETVRAGVGAFVDGSLQYDPPATGGAPKVVLDNGRCSIYGGGPKLEGSQLSMCRATLEGVASRIEFRPFKSREGKDLRLASLSLCTTLPQEGESRWHRLTFFNARCVEYIEQSVHPGDSLHVQASMKYRSYTDAKGTERYAVELVVQSLLQHTPKKSSTVRPAAFATDPTAVEGGDSAPSPSPIRPNPTNGSYGTTQQDPQQRTASPWQTPQTQGRAVSPEAPAIPSAPAAETPPQVGGGDTSPLQSPVFGPEVDVRKLQPYEPAGSG